MQEKRESEGERESERKRSRERHQQQESKNPRIIEIIEIIGIIEIHWDHWTMFRKRFIEKSEPLNPPSRWTCADGKQSVWARVAACLKLAEAPEKTEVFENCEKTNKKHKRSSFRTQLLQKPWRRSPSRTSRSGGSAPWSSAARRGSSCARRRTRPAPAVRL